MNSFKATAYSTRVDEKFLLTPNTPILHWSRSISMGVQIACLALLAS